MKSPNTFFEIDEPGPSDLKAYSKFKDKRKLMQHFLMAMISRASAMALIGEVKI